jgi:hypothetical protein
MNCPDFDICGECEKSKSMHPDERETTNDQWPKTKEQSKKAKEQNTEQNKHHINIT